MDPKTYYITASADIIKKRAKFLEEKGFEFYSEDEYSIVYRNYEKNIQISVFLKDILIRKVVLIYLSVFRPNTGKVFMFGCLM